MIAESTVTNSFAAEASATENVSRNDASQPSFGRSDSGTVIARPAPSQQSQSQPKAVNNHSANSRSSVSVSAVAVGGGELTVDEPK